MRRSRLAAAAAAVLLAVAAPERAGCQNAAEISSAEGAWNSARVLRMIDLAGAVRARPFADSSLMDYRADARGWVYFFLDREDTRERTLIRVDQVALEVYWRLPGFTKQRIVGYRDADRLPNRMHYHLDHLTVVQNEFGNTIRMGDGDEVQDVPHPAAPAARNVYDYRLADSMSLYLPGAPEPVRVYEVQIRPREFDRPAIIGSLFLDRSSAEIVRMSFTFTPVSYVDRRLDYIRVSLDNGLWEGRYWLPHEQRLEIRRQLPELDLPAGAVIRGRFRISDYRFNQDLPISLFLSGSRIEALPEEERERFAFEEDLYADLEAEGLEPAADLSEIRQRAMQIAGRRYLSGLPRLRLHAPDASSVARYNRAEGLVLGGGFAYVPTPALELALAGAYAFGADQASGSATLSSRSDGLDRSSWSVYANQLRDLGQTAGLPGLLNTFSAALLGRDYLDPYFATGTAAALHREFGPGWLVGVAGRWERHDTATLVPSHVESGEFRPLIPAAEGDLLEGAISLQHLSAGATTTWTAETRVAAGTFDGEPFLEPRLTAALEHPLPRLRGRLRAELDAGATFGEKPVQKTFLLGGRGTVPGYPYRAFAGSRYVRIAGEASYAVWDPWVTVRATSAAAGISNNTAGISQNAVVFTTDTMLLSAGFGFGLVSDVLRLDFLRGLTDLGRWEFVLSVRPDLREIL